MPPAREKMRPWLVRQINSNTITGLCWVNKEKTMFSVPWIHAAKQGWEMDKDACLFQRWAIHTGKYVAGQECNPKHWKTNFRCALNSLTDVVEVKELSVQRGQGAKRVFRLLPETHRPRDRRTKPRKTKSKRKIKIEEPDSDYEESSSSPFQQPPLSQAPTQESTVDSTVDSQQSDVKMEMEVPDWSQIVEVEVGAERYDFQVSPEHSPDSSDYVYNNLTITICQPLKKDAHWSSVKGKGFPANELCTSPGSHWSEASSGEEIEELPLYTTLSPPFPPEVWSTSLPQTLFSFHDEAPLL